MSAPTALPGESPNRPPARDVLDDAALRRWLFRARDALGRHRQRLDALNVYPVPDGDTGTNLFLTLDGGLDGFVDVLVAHAREAGGEAGALGLADGVAALARSTLYAARGNSGVILSQLVAGLAATVAAHPEVESTGLDGRLFALALAEADTRGRQAVADPVEGTILTVARAAARAAQGEVDAGRAGLSQVLDAACRAADDSLRHTPDQLDALAQAGVVDAGGAGLVVVLDALAAIVHGDAPAEEAVLVDGPAATERSSVAVPGDDPAFEVMYLLDAVADPAAQQLTRQLRDLGDSVLVAGDRRLRTVHVHTADPGGAVEAGIEVGRPYGIRITLLTDGSPGPCMPREAGGEHDGADAPALGVVACVQSPGLCGVFEEAGAVVVADAPGQRVTPAHLIAAARGTGAAEVVVLPDDGDALLAAGAAAEVAAEEGLTLTVVPTRHLVQGLAALAVYAADEPESVERMRVAAQGVRCGVVATVTTSADTEIGSCEPGDVLGFVEDRAAHLGGDLLAVAREVTASLVALHHAEAELVTVVEGADARGVGTALADALAPDGVEVEVLDGGQAVYDLLIGVE